MLPIQRKFCWKFTKLVGWSTETVRQIYKPFFWGFQNLVLLPKFFQIRFGSGRSSMIASFSGLFIFFVKNDRRNDFTVLPYILARQNATGWLKLEITNLPYNGSIPGFLIMRWPNRHIKRHNKVQMLSRFRPVAVRVILNSFKNALVFVFRVLKVFFFLYFYISLLSFCGKERNK